MKSLVEYITEVSGRILEDDNWTWVNNEDDGKDLYAVKIGWGSGYIMDCYCAYADDEESALEFVVVWLEENDPKSLEAVDNAVKSYSDDEDIIDDTFIYVDATMNGASKPHYLYSDNLVIVKFPKNKIPKRSFNESEIEPQIKEGDILVAVFQYSSRHVAFYRVTERRNMTIRLEELKNKWVKGDGYYQNGEVVADTDAEGTPLNGTYRVKYRDYSGVVTEYVKIKEGPFKGKVATKWDGTPEDVYTD